MIEHCLQESYSGRADLSNRFMRIVGVGRVCEIRQTTPFTTIFLFGKGAPGVVSNAVPSFGKSSGGFVKSIVPTIETAVTTVNPGEMQLFLVEQKYIYSGAPLERTRY